MVSTICLPISHILIIFCVFLGLTVLYNEKNKSTDIKIIDERISNAIKNEIRKSEPLIRNPIRNPIRENMTSRDKYINDEELERRDFLKRRDAGVITNVLHPPERRVPEHNYPFNFVKAQLNIPTRGLPDNFHQLGVVLRDDTETGYNLFGRQKFPGSNQYEYYVVGTMGFNNVKLPIKIKGDKEVEEGQIIDIPGAKKENGNFKVKLYDYDAPRYNPHV